MKKLDLELIKNKSKEILESLPIAHYLKVDTIGIVFDESAETSYFNPNEFNIHIALCNISAALGDSEEELSELELEKIIRGFLYHEVSHAILTPKMLKSYYKYAEVLTPNILNILEDERIETILKDYYLLVDFRENLRKVCKPTTPKNFEHFVFNAVRLKCCGKYQSAINLKVLQFVKSTYKCNATEGVYNLLDEMKSLTTYLLEIWKEIITKAKSEDETSSKEESEEKAPGEDSETSESESTSSKEEKPEGDSDIEDESDPAKSEKVLESSSKDEELSEEEIDTIESELSSTDDSDSDIVAEMGVSACQTSETMEQAIETLKKRAVACGTRKMKLSDFTSESKTKVELLKTIVRNKGVGVVEQQANYGYSGRFNAKRFMKDHNESYKWFEKKAYQSTGLESKKASKKVLNIWLDQSGSFMYNDKAINKVLKALAEIEEKQKDFEWRLIKLTCNVEVVKEKEDRYSNSFSGNALPVNKMRKVYNEVNATQNEFNVVLFDGNANSLDFGFAGNEKRISTEEYSFDALKPFNNKRTIFITEKHNLSQIKATCPNAKEIINEDKKYAECLAQNIVRALDLLF